MDRSERKREKLRNFSKNTVLFMLGFATWIPVLIINWYFHNSYSKVGYAVFPEFLPVYIRSSFYAMFFVANYILIDRIIRQNQQWDVIDLLWKLLVIGISGISITFLFQIIEQSLKGNAIHPQIVALSASVNLYASLVFCLSTIFIYRKLILYQKNKRKVWFWNTLQIIFLLGLARLFIGMHSPISFGAVEPEPSLLESLYGKVLIPFFLVVSLFLSANVNWSAYLNFNQKLKSLFLIFVILMLYVAFFMKFPEEGLANNSIVDALFGQYILFDLFFIFPVIYTLFSGLVLIFNLPTSSVFEKRGKELMSLQRINQAIQSNFDVGEILETLLDASLLTSNATGGWIEQINEETGETEITFQRAVRTDEIKEITSRENFTEAVVKSGKPLHIKNLRKHRSFRFTRSRFRSLLVLPILTSKRVIGVVYLINELTGSFEDETVTSLSSLSEQSGISIENAELVARSIDLEVYNEQLRVAKTFQRQILPQNLPSNDKIDFFVMGQDVDEIGGDFYDVTQSGSCYKIAVGDVSGKGTTAAFYMAETKGIFQALTQIDIGVRDFVINANKALSNCLRKNSFMTLTYMVLDTDKMEIEFFRAGHCQTLFYDASEDSLETFEEGGPGLGIIRNDSFANYIGQAQRVPISSGDLIVLFTDGITEAKNKEREDFGFEKLREIVFRLRKTDPKLICETLVQQVKNFTGSKIEDDYSILVIKIL